MCDILVLGLQEMEYTVYDLMAETRKTKVGYHCLMTCGLKEANIVEIIAWWPPRTKGYIYLSICRNSYSSKFMKGD